MSTEKQKKIHSSGNEGEMTFLDHLEDLRWRIIYSAIGVVAATIIAWIFIDYLVNGILISPARQYHIKLLNIRPFGQIMLYFEIAIIAGIVLSLPNILYQLWKFISPALRDNEKKYIFSIVVFSSVSFIIGILFAYYVMIPLCMIFAVQFGSAFIENNFAIEEYFNIIISIMLACGLVFELPMVSFFLSKLGILHPKFMRRYRRHAIIFIVIAAGFLTPGTDPVSQLALAIPLVLLYEISIFVSKISQKKK